MSETFVNQSFGTGQAATGVLVANTFTGTNIASGASTITINGNVNLPGSPVTVDANLVGLVGAGLQGTYVGFSQPQGVTEPIYYFSVSPGGLSSPVTVAVSAGQLSTATLLAPVNTTPTVTAPDSQTIVCFASGTRIRTAKGDIRVEELRVGDDVVTSSGARRAIRWLGHRTIACTGRTDLAQVLPVRIARDAFGEGRPARDLLVSPAHAICVDLLGEILVPACRLINGTTITQIAVDEITYWHVELDSHDILLAEGLPAESYVECGNRGFFANTGVIDLDAAPDARPSGPQAFCRPLIEGGPLVEALRERLDAKAVTLGWTLVETPLAELRIVADGRIVRPESHGLSARVRLPADTKDVWLECETSVPAHLGASTDDRALGICLAALTADDGLSLRRTLSAGSPELAEGFYEAGEGHRWTGARARVPASLWQGCRDEFFLRIDLAAPALPRWVDKGHTEAKAELRLVA
ncbi:Hint domain-containing protein [Methylorubrum salsuginis]|uniref:Hint domain-containing protein n=1 Tax=Methylorubrum salsuginis TaxID=414703 RepID=A0A1I4GBS6_9HYPH|nr:Hint domain-containing protein [Methylorubrum salsuginis]SFL26611.1 Hint domain-containing protein [Methylorubrum salsuginis]